MIIILFFPTTPGQAGGTCNGINENTNGGVIHISAGKIILEGESAIRANGVNGGGGGSVWIDAGPISSTSNSKISAIGDYYSGYPSIFQSFISFH